MQPPSAALRLVAAATTLLSAAQAADEPFLGPLAPFEVSALSAPCGAANSHNVTLTVANPNRVTAGRAPHAEGGGYWSFENSTARCATGGCAEVSSASSSSSAQWSFRVSNGTEAGFDVAFTLVYNVTRWGGVYYKVLEGTGRFVVGEQLVKRGGDDDDGCELVLADGAAPVLVPPTITDCKGTC
ncbi:hypothetical protein F5X96DRAFT_646792 [Biscogniauxia mediterranea]|nr:hypothetical protein F5X96DRAFT_646792 [Biscogniauxia mediterranea]